MQFSRKKFIQTLGLGSAGLAFNPKKSSHALNKQLNRITEDPPNLVFVFGDQLRYQSTGYGGDERAHTPNMNRLAEQGTDFYNCVSSTPVCTAYRGSLMTGKYASSTGIVVNELRVNNNQQCFGHILTQAGYDTGYFGKWHLYANEAGNHTDPKNSYIPPGPDRLGFDGEWRAYNFDHNNYGGYYHRNSPEKIFYGEGVYEPDAQTGFAVEYIKRASKKENPFAVFLSLGDPHDPWTKDNVKEEYYDMFKDVTFELPESWSDTPDPYMDRNTDPERWIQHWKENIPEFMRGYYAQTAALDNNLGKVMQTLEEAGVADNTIVVFSSDHGEMFGAHGRVFKMIFYEESARIPFLIRWPGHIPEGQKLDTCIAPPDFMPTLLSLMGLPVPSGVEGMDLSHRALGKAGPEPDFAFLQGMGHTFLWIDGHEWRALRDKRYTYATYRVDGSELLFDNREDPHQMNNLVNDSAYSGKLKELRGKLKAKMEELNDGFHECSWYRDHWTSDRIILRGAKGQFYPWDDCP